MVVAGLGISECGDWFKSPIPGGLFSCGNFDASRGGGYLEGETHDRLYLDLPPGQQQLLTALLALNKPVVIFLLNGGAVTLDLLSTDDSHENVAVIEAFYPGAEGGQALADSIFGRANRWGKMPYTIYKKGWEKENNFLEHEVSTSNRTYRYGADALVPFGYGLSLTNFQLDLVNGTGATPGDLIVINTNGTSPAAHLDISVTNLGATLSGDEVVQVYLIPVKVENMERLPVKTLINFQRIHDLAPKSKREISFQLDYKQLLLVNMAGERVSAPGLYKLSVETGGYTQGVHVDLELVGHMNIVESFPSVTGRGL